MVALKRLLAILPELRLMMIIATVDALIIEILKLIPPYLLKLSIDQLQVSSPSLGYIVTLVTSILITSLIITVVEDRSSARCVRNSKQVEVSILRRMQQKLLSLDIDFHEKNPSGELIHTTTRGAGRLHDLVWFLQGQFIGAFLQILLTCIVILSIHPTTGGLFLIFMPVVLFLIHWSGQRLQPYRKKYHQAFRDANWYMSQSVRNIRTVKDFVQEGTEQEKYGKGLDKFITLATERERIEGRDALRRDVVLNIARFVVIFYAVYMVYENQMTTGTLVLFYTLTEKVISSLFRLGRLYSYLGDAMQSVNSMTDLLGNSSELIDKSNRYNEQNPKPVVELQKEIRFEDLSFSYKNGTEVLHAINLTIPAHKTTALVGRSGAGKTTIVKLLLRHYDATKGKILLDGKDITDFPLNDYKQNIAVVSQDVEIFDLSIRDNIAYGNKSATEQEIIQACKAAYAHEFIQSFPEGYNTRVGERGLKLSGGQRQRIGIARALLLKPVILVFDEATSSLDSESEQLIQRALSELAKEEKHTLVVIAHRLSTIRNANLIVVMEQGKIAEAASHEQLLENNGIYNYMIQLQNQGGLRA